MISGAQAAVRLSGSEISLLRAVNAVRTSHGVGPLRVDAALQHAARSHTARMARTGSFTHGNFAWRMRRFHVRGPTIAENIGWASGTDAIVQVWMASAAHRVNMLRPGFRRIGVGAQVDGTGTMVATADFAGH